MNYYEHHIGDYDQATAHLTACEDGIYSRLIRWYYASEAPLPTDIKAIERRVRAHSREEKAAVKTVLAEFFELRGDGYHQHRCDEDVAAFHAKRPEAEAKKGNDRERQRRARDRRKQLFEALRGHGVVAPWDATTGQLQDALSRVTSEAGNRDGDAPVTPPVTRDNTATQSPVPSPQSPDSLTPVVSTPTTAARAPTADSIPGKPEEDPPGNRFADPPSADDPPLPPPTAEGLMAAELRQRGVRCTGSHPDLRGLVADGFTVPEVVEALAVAAMADGAPKPMHVGYLAAVVRSERERAKRPARRAAPGWWTTEALTEAKAREVGCWPARGGETWDQLRARIRLALSEQERAA